MRHKEMCTSAVQFGAFGVLAVGRILVRNCGSLADPRDVTGATVEGVSSQLGHALSSRLRSTTLCLDTDHSQIRFHSSAFFGQPVTGKE